MLVKCDTCSKEFERSQSLIKKRKHHFCSRACYDKGQAIYRSGENHHTYGMRITARCDICSKDFQRAPSQINGHEHLFCSNKCRGEWLRQRPKEEHYRWRGGRVPYGKNWRKQAELARQRDNYTCQCCGITQEQIGRKLDVHHVIPLRDFRGDWKQANRLENLVTLCPQHHREEDDEQWKQRDSSLTRMT